MKGKSLIAVSVFAVAGLSGCGSGGVTVPALGTPPISGDSPSVGGNPIDVYSLFARNALVCWFGADGPLRSTHIFHADVPASHGGAEVVVHERDPAQPNPRGARVFQISLSRESNSSTRVVIDSKKIPDDLASAMRKDVLAWVRGGGGCEAQVARPPAVPVIAAVPAKKVRPKH